MVTKALFVRLEAKPGKAGDLEKLLKAAIEGIRAEPGTINWFILRLSETTFGIFDTFHDEAGRLAHTQGRMAAAFEKNAVPLLAGPPKIEPADILGREVLSFAVGPDATLQYS